MTYIFRLPDIGEGIAEGISGESQVPVTVIPTGAASTATSGADEGRSEFRKSTIATATPWAAMIRPHALYMPSKQDMIIMPPP